MPSAVGYPAVITTTNIAVGRCGFGGPATAILIYGEPYMTWNRMLTVLDIHLNEPVICAGGGRGGTPHPISPKYTMNRHRIVRECDDFICLKCGAHLKYVIVNDPWCCMEDNG